MKTKIIFFTIAMTLCIGVAAQPRIAVLDFSAGVNVSQSDVDGLSAIFNTYFDPAGYTVVERTRVNRILDEHKIQRNKDITEKDMVRLGEILNVPVIVIGDVNLAMGQYNIDIRAVNVETGAIIAKDGAEWTKGTSYRETMRAIAERMSKKIPLIEFYKPEPIKIDTTPKPKKVIPKYRPEGWYVMPELLSPSAISIGNQVTSSFSYYFGFGIFAFEFDGGEREGPAIPVYAGIRASTPQYNFSLFADVRLGFDLQKQTSEKLKKRPLMTTVQVGIMCRQLSMGAGVSLYFNEFVGSSSYDLSVEGIPAISISYRIPFKKIHKWLY